MTGHLRNLATVWAATLVLAACGGGDGGDGGDGTTGAGDAEVAMVDISFDPVDVEIATGGTVHWTNEDAVTHTVTFDDGPDSGDLAGGETFEHTFDEPGEHGYVCTLHPGMAGTVTVTG